MPGLVLDANILHRPGQCHCHLAQGFPHDSVPRLVLSFRLVAEFRVHHLAVPRHWNVHEGSPSDGFLWQVILLELEHLVID